MFQEMNLHGSQVNQLWSIVKIVNGGCIQIPGIRTPWLTNQRKQPRTVSRLRDGKSTVNGVKLVKFMFQETKLLGMPIIKKSRKYPACGREKSDWW